MEEFNSETVEQTEQVVNSILVDDEVVIIDEEIKKLINVSDDEINSSLNALVNVNAPVVKKMRGRSKKPINILADEIVNEYLTTRSDKSWQQLQEFFWYGVKDFAHKFVKNWDDAYDMTIETFINALTKIDSYDPEKSKFSTWLWTICKNNCLGFIKNNQRMTMVDNDISDIYDSEMFSTSYGQNLTSLDYSLNNNGEIERVDIDDVCKELYNVSVNEMHNIGGIAGQILEMKLIKNMKIREIAVELHMNESTIKNYLYKNKENLARILKINHKNLVESYYDLNAVEDEKYY